MERIYNHRKWFYSLAVLALLVAVYAGFGVEAAIAGTLALPGAVTLEEVAEQLNVSTQKMADNYKDVKAANEELSRKMGEQGTVIDQKLKDAIDDVLKKFNEMGQQQKDALTDFEQKFSRLRLDNPGESESWGDQLIKGEAFKGFKEKGSNPRSSFRHEVKQVTTTTAAGLLRQPYQDTIVAMPRQRLTIRDLLPVIPITTGSVDYPVQNVRTNAAAAVAEGAPKPYSDYGWTTATVPVRTLAHLAKLTRQAIDDAPRLVAEVNSEMRYGLGLVEEAQLLSGNNTGQNLHGILPQAAAFAAPAGTGNQIRFANRIDVLRVAMLQVALALYPTDGIVLHPTDWVLIQLEKTEDGALIISNPISGAQPPSMWGLPVVDTPSMVQGDFLVGSFRFGAALYDRMSVELLISTENDKDFENNLATMRAEERIALGVKRPNSFVTGDFAAAITALLKPEV